MRFSVVSSTALLATYTAAAPTGSKRDFSPDNVYFPLSNGFPNPSQDQILQIQIEGHGTLPNGPPPPTLSSEGVTNLQLIALNELFEVAYFTELVYNVTNKVPGYDLGYGHEYVLDSLKSIVAQEELHLLNANGALKHFNHDPIQPCKYSFPVTDFQSAIGLAGTFTDLVLGTLQDVNQIFAQSGDAGLVRAVSSVIGNEAEQEGFYRLVQKKRPSAQPFLTTATRDFAFTAIQSFTVPGSCPNIAGIKLKTFKPLNVESTGLKPATQNIKFSINKADAGLYQMDGLRLVYINAQNVPVVKKLDNVQMGADKTTFEAAFPFDEFRMNGLTIAAVTQGKDSFASADEVAAAAVFGPGLIEID
ncbi:late sexual development protein [Paraphoma chrysanthemicola]|uniref:Late sexual development protein n=1 Tax=Paraphoma chrysanthemicola TaxID=798071 RepID=A0A8K0QTT4_9PLEO|nr:late sexual development protein [Paraphoma chrysanthemicola]